MHLDEITPLYESLYVLIAKVNTFSSKIHQQEFRLIIHF